MAACEKCWADAQFQAHHSGKSVVDEYYRLLRERNDHPCSPEEQRGDRQRVEKP